MSIEARRTERGAAARYDVRYRGSDGRQRKRTFRTKREAERFEREARVEVDQGRWLNPDLGKTPLSEVAAEWLADPTKRRSSFLRERTILDRHVLPALGAIRVGSIKPADIQRLVNGWVAGGLATSTVLRQHSVLRALLSFAEGQGMLAENPALVRSPRRPHGVKLPHAELVDRPELSAEDLEVVATALGEWAPFMWCGAVLGLRWAETAGLALGNVDLEEGILRVRLQLDRDGQLMTPKTSGSRRTLAMPEWLAEDLKILVARRGVTDTEDLVFVDSVGGPLRYSNWRRRVWQPAVTEAGFPHLRYHDLRSVAASALIAAGVDVKTVQARLGHANPQTTLGIYARALSDRDRQAADAVGSLLHR